MKTLLEKTDDKYLRRLVRELNGQTNGFYVPFVGFNVRCNRARLVGGEFQVKSFDHEWFAHSGEVFDCYGSEIVASRKP